MKSVVAPVNKGITWVTFDQFPSDQRPGASRDNPVHLSDATDASASGSRPGKEDDFDDEAKLLGHFSNTLREMATSIVDLEDGYFRALHEVIVETKRALRDVSRIDAHYVSQVITVMSSWQEVVQTAASHMEGIDTTIYLACHEDTQKATREYVAAVVKAREEHDAAHAVEEKARRQALKDDDHGDPVVHLLHVTQTVAHTQCEKAVNDEERGSQLGDDNLDLGQEADDEGDGEKDLANDETLPDLSELELLQEIIDPAAHNQLPSAPKSGDKRGPSHLDGGSASSDLSVEDLDAKGAHPKKKGSKPTKASGSHPSQWMDEDIDIVRQTRYKTDLQHFQTYRLNKINPGNMASINTKDHSAYIEVVWADPGSVICKSVISVAAYREVLKWKGGDVSQFEKEVDTKFKKGPRGSLAPDTKKVAIKRVMLVCQCENGVNVKYSDSDRFGRPGTMGLWDLHSSDAVNWAKMHLPSSSVDANFCPCCVFWSTKNETLNNHVRKHYGMGLTCLADGFTMASVAAMKAHMESEHGYEGKHTGAVKKPKGKG